MKNLINLSIPLLVFFLFSCTNNDMGNMMNNNMNMTGEPVPVTEGNFTSPLIIPTVVGSSTTLTAQNVWANINGFGNISGCLLYTSRCV